MIFATLGFIFNFITTFAFFAYAFTHPIDGQLTVYFWLALLLTSVASSAVSYLSKTKELIVLIFCSLPFFGLINLFMLPVNLNSDFLTGFSVPTIIILLLQIIICRMLLRKSKGASEK